MGKTCREEEPDDQSHTQSQKNALPGEADYLRVGIADQQVRDQRRDASGEEHGVHLIRHLFPLH